MSADEPDDDDDAARRDLDHGLRFLHTMGMQTKFDVQEALTRVLALTEELVSRGQLDTRSLDERRERIKKQEAVRSKSLNVVQVAPPIDKYQMTDLPQIDCDARIPLCGGRCCRLTFPLSFQDLDEGVVKWEYRMPYLIKHRVDDGYCVHSHVETRGCTVYEHRPAVCRSYDCRKDQRIWLDFDARIPAPWPNQNPPPTSREVHGERVPMGDADDAPLGPVPKPQG